MFYLNITSLPEIYIGRPDPARQQDPARLLVVFKRILELHFVQKALVLAKH